MRFGTFFVYVYVLCSVPSGAMRRAPGDRSPRPSEAGRPRKIHESPLGALQGAQSPTSLYEQGDLFLTGLMTRLRYGIPL